MSNFGASEAGFESTNSPEGVKWRTFVVHFQFNKPLLLTGFWSYAMFVRSMPNLMIFLNSILSS